MSHRMIPSQPPRTLAPGIAAFLAVAAASCHRSSDSGSGTSSFTLENLGLPVLQLQGEDDLWLVTVQEAAHGPADLNGDGDALDAVLFVYDAATGRLENAGVAVTGLPLPVCPSCPGFLPPFRPQVDGGLAVVVVDEARQGATDLNGDGDAEDDVLHLYDAATGGLRNLGFAVLAIGDLGVALDGDTVAFAVSEDAQGMDLDGDGLALDLVLFVHDIESGRTTNTLLALTIPDISVDEGEVAFFAKETPLTGDLNGDGDTTDPSVFHVHDARANRLLNARLAGEGQRPLRAAGIWTVLVSEELQGGTDANGDGDALDRVFHTFDPATGRTESTGLASLFSNTSSSSGERQALIVHEDSMGLDLNGDGDLADNVPAIHDPVLGQGTNLGLAASEENFHDRARFLDDGWYALSVSEAHQGGADLNGDGDGIDTVLHVLDLATGVTLNTGLDVESQRAAGRYLLLARDEAQAATDWNGDGDRLDVTLHVWDGRTATVRNSGSSLRSTLGARGDTILFTAYEADEGRDLNGDGDLKDLPLVAHDAVTGRTLAFPFPGGPVWFVSPDEFFVLLIERVEDEDLNGDGDLEDFVVHLVRLASRP